MDQGEIHIIPIKHIQDIQQGESLSEVILEAIKKQDLQLQNNDIFVITQKIVSKAEGRIVDFSQIEPSPFAIKIAKENKKDPKYIELILRETKRIVRMDHGVLICETHHGFICANAGVDASNVGKEYFACLLPENPDASAKKIREEIEKALAIRATRNTFTIPIIISDTWGRPWREGQVNFAIGSSGIEIFADYRGKKDHYGHDLQVSLIAIADELASAAELVMGKIANVPVAIIRGYTFTRSQATAKKLIRDKKMDLFR